MGQNVFVTGATGVLGRRLVPHLIEAGHQVTAVARTPEKAEALRATGTTPIEVDLFDRPALRAALEGHDAVAQMATNIPTGAAAADPSAWQTNNSIRSKAAPAIAGAASDVGVARFALVGDVDGYVSFIDMDDAASAVVAALDVPAGTYNVAEPDPLRRSAHRVVLAGLVGRAGLEPVPDPVGGGGANVLARSHRISSRQLSNVSPWTPTVHCIDQWKELR